MKKIIFTFFLLTLIFPVKAFDIHSNNAILYNLKDNAVLYEKNSEEKISIASLTKITTAIVAIEKISSLDEKIVMTSSMFEGLIEANASTAGFKVGQTVTYRDLLYGTLFPSGADATKGLAISLTGSEGNFVKLMNEKASSLGLKNTHYTNSSGLDDDNHYSTVKDVAIMLQYALQNTIFKEIFTGSYYITSDSSIQMISPLLRNSNKYQLSVDYIKGGKTGFTDSAGYCLASIASYNDINYMLVTATSDSESKQPLNFLDAITIYSYYFDNYEYKSLINVGDLLTKVKVEKSTISSLDILSKEKIEAYLPKDAKITYEYQGLDIINPDYHENSKIGTLFIKSNNQIIQEIEVLVPVYIKRKASLFLIITVIILFLVFLIKYFPMFKKKWRKLCK